MDYCLSNHSVSARQLLLPSALKPGSSNSGRSIACPRPLPPRRRSLSVTAGPSHCESSSSLNTPLVPRSPVGKYLSRVLQNQRQLFHVAVSEELKHLADDRNSAVARMVLSDGSDEASLHRRIVELKEHNYKHIIQDVMYMLILFKFSEIKVHLVPKLSTCIYNGRLEIWPAKDWELESMYSYEVLELIREHVHAVTGLKPNSSVTDHWATTQVRKCHLSNIYAASILYGYFLKSASLRLNLEKTLALSNSNVGNVRNSLHSSKTSPYGWNNLVFGQRGKTETNPSPLDRTSSKLSCYVMGFDPDTLHRCAKVKSRAATELIERQTIALFGDRPSMVGKEKDDIITTSFSSLKRLVLEAVAFGAFLWDVEEDVDSLYSIREK